MYTSHGIFMAFCKLFPVDTICHHFSFPLYSLCFINHPALSFSFAISNAVSYICNTSPIVLNLALSSHVVSLFWGFILQKVLFYTTRWKKYSFFGLTVPHCISCTCKYQITSTQDNT
jgi:predicted permease